MGKIGIMEILIIVVALGSIIPGILYLVSLQSTLNEVSINTPSLVPPMKSPEGHVSFEYDRD